MFLTSEVETSSLRSSAINVQVKAANRRGRGTQRYAGLIDFCLYDLLQRNLLRIITSKPAVLTSTAPPEDLSLAQAG